MDMIGRIRRLHVRDKLSEREIARMTGLSRNTVSKWLRAPAPSPAQSADVDEQSLDMARATREEVSRLNAELMYIPAWISFGRSMPVSYPMQ